MNLPFPTLTPRIIDSRWFTADTPCDEEIEVTMIEQKFQLWLTSVGQRYLNMNPLGKTAPEPMEEAETDEEEGNDDSDDTEDTHDDEDDEEMAYSRGGEGAVMTGLLEGTVPHPAGGNNNNDVVMNDNNANSDRPSL